MMTTSDLCSSCKPWEKHKEGVRALFAEFHDQVRILLLASHTIKILMMYLFMMIRIITGWQGESIGIDSTGNDGQRLQTYTAFFPGLYTDERVWEFS